MLKKILLDRQKKSHKPIVSWVLIFCCLLISLPVFLFPVLREVFSTSGRTTYPWWFITAVFVHDNRVIPFNMHIIGNITVIAFFGTIAERLLGSARILLITVTALLAQLSVSLIMNNYGNGASGIAWAMAPLVLPVMLYDWKKKARKAFKDPFFLSALFLYFLIWVLITVISYHWGLHNTNIWHLTATIVGLLFMLVWRKDIYSNLLVFKSEKGKVDKSKLSIKLSQKAIIMLPILLLLILSGIVLNIIEIGSPAQIKSIYPTDLVVEEVNENDARIRINFDQPMSTSYSSKTKLVSAVGDLEVFYNWENEVTFVIKFSRILKKGDEVEISLELRDKLGKNLYKDLYLKYPENGG